jgi:hypothetical protein
MILLLLSIQAAECNIWCISEGYDKGSYNLTTKSCECSDCYEYWLVRVKKKWVSNKTETKVNEAYDNYDESPYLKIK